MTNGNVTSGAKNAREPVIITIAGKLYDVAAWLPKHPGGQLTIRAVQNTDCTDKFTVMHPKEAWKFLPQYEIGPAPKTKGSEQTPLQVDFHAMMRKMEEEGLYKASMPWYILQWTAILSLLALAVVGTLYSTTLWQRCMCGFMLGLVWHQTAFLGHDYGHNSVHGRGMDWYASLIVTSLFGVTAEWWKKSHNVHHVITNSIEDDPDIQHLPIFAISEEMLDGFFSTYHNKRFSFDRIARVLVSYQHYLFYPVLLFVARYNLMIQSVLTAFDWTTNKTKRVIEFGSMFFHFVWYFYLLSRLPDWTSLILYHIIANAVAGLVHIQIVISHFAMPTAAPCATPESDEFIRSQLATTMDVDCPRWLDWLHGGLQFQAVHHLTPRMPRHNLRYVRDNYILALSNKHNLGYKLHSFWECNGIVISNMRRVAHKAYAMRYGSKPAQHTD